MDVGQDSGKQDHFKDLINPLINSNHALTKLALLTQTANSNSICITHQSTLNIQFNDSSCSRSNDAFVSGQSSELDSLQYSAWDYLRDHYGDKESNNSIRVVSSRNRSSISYSSLNHQRYRNYSNLVVLNRSYDTKSTFGPSLLLANTMSLAPKIDEVRFCYSGLKTQFIGSLPRPG